MTFIRRQLRAFTWIAVLAMLGLAFAPTISRAMSAAGDAGPWSQICTTSDAKAPIDSPSTKAGHHLDHCALCASASGPMGMPPASTALPRLPDLADHVAELFDLAPRPLFAWAAAQPRAPPAFS